jgi:hypothetical protein
MLSVFFLEFQVLVNLEVERKGTWIPWPARDWSRGKEIGVRKWG